jgi:hypothetical protein
LKSWTDFPTNVALTDGNGNPVLTMRTTQSGGSVVSPETLIDQNYYVAPGLISTSYNQGVAMFSNDQLPWYERGIGLVASTAMAPMMLLEETGRALLNVPYHGRQAGFNAAQFAQANNNEQRIVAGLKFVNNASAGFLGGLAVVPGSVSMKPQVLTPQQMALAQFPGAEATAAARATYGANSVGNVSSLEATASKGGWPGIGGAGPVPGTIGIADQTSVGALKNYNPKGGGVEFVYDSGSNTFVAGRPAAGLFDGSPHQQLAHSIGAADRPIVGGTMQRGANGEFFFTENSGHYGQNWTNANRQQFTDWFSQRVGSPVNHNPWSGK